MASRIVKTSRATPSMTASVQDTEERGEARAAVDQWQEDVKRRLMVQLCPRIEQRDVAHPCSG
jgi:hypothetical protein